MRSRKGIEAAAQKIANLVLSERLDPQQAHAVFSALKIIFESLKFSETIEAEYKLKEYALEVQAMRETNARLYERLAELGVASPVEVTS